MPIGATRYTKCFGYCAKDELGNWYNAANKFDTSCCGHTNAAIAARCKPFCFGVKNVDAHQIDVKNCPKNENLTVPPSGTGAYSNVSMRYHNRDNGNEILGCMSPQQKLTQGWWNEGLGPLPAGAMLMDVSPASDFACPTPNVCNLKLGLPTTSVNDFHNLMDLGAAGNWAAYPKSGKTEGTNPSDIDPNCVEYWQVQKGKNINRVCNRPQGTKYVKAIHEQTFSSAYSFAYDDAFGLMQTPAKETRFVLQFCPSGSPNYPAYEDGSATLPNVAGATINSVTYTTPDTTGTASVSAIGVPVTVDAAAPAPGAGQSNPTAVAITACKYHMFGN